MYYSPSSPLKLKSVAVPNTITNGVYPSDHDPVVIGLTVYSLVIPVYRNEESLPDLLAAVLALAAYQLGTEDLAVYDGSWTEWGGRPDTPVEAES